jgi:hypothetical protein
MDTRSGGLQIAVGYIDPNLLLTAVGQFGKPGCHHAASPLVLEIRALAALPMIPSGLFSACSDHQIRVSYGLLEVFGWVSLDLQFSGDESIMRPLGRT